MNSGAEPLFAPARLQTAAPGETGDRADCAWRLHDVF